MSNIDNTFKKLKDNKIPVSENEWQSIINDPKVKQAQHNKSPRFSAKSKIIIASAVAIIAVSVPILVHNLNKTTTIDNQKLVSVQKENVDQTFVDNSQQQLSIVKTETPSVINPRSEKPNAIDITALNDNLFETKQDDNINPDNTVAEAHNGTSLQKSSELAETHNSTSIQKPSELAETHNVETRLGTSQQKGEIVNENDDAALEYYEQRGGSADEETETSENKFFIPSAFTPNSDGLNDIFYVKANFEPKNFEMSIFSRHGDLMFRTRDINIGWDGMYHGSHLPNGVYMYVIRYKDNNGKDKIEQGQVLLIQ